MENLAIIERKIKALSDTNEPIEPTDIVANLKDIYDIIIKDLPESRISQQLTDEQIKILIFEKINLDVNNRNKIINDIANLQHINPDNRSFSTIDLNRREYIIQNLINRRKEIQKNLDI